MHTCIVGPRSALAKETMRAFVRRGLVSTIDRDSAYHHDGVPVDALITFPGKVRNNTIVNMTEDEWDEVIADTLSSVHKALWTVVPAMADVGHVVIVGSIMGTTGGYGCANYAAAKAGLVGLVRAAANELAPKIRVNLLELGYVNAGMGLALPPKVREKVEQTIPLKRFAEPWEVVKAIEFLVDQTYMTGNILTFAGGLR